MVSNLKNQELYIKLKAEILKYWHDTRNAGKFINGFSQEMANKLAENDFKISKDRKWFDLSLEEMLTLEPEECCLLKEERTKVKIKEFVEANID